MKWTPALPSRWRRRRCLLRRPWCQLSSTGPGTGGERERVEDAPGVVDGVQVEAVADHPEVQEVGVEKAASVKPARAVGRRWVAASEMTRVVPAMGFERW